MFELFELGDVLWISQQDIGVTRLIPVVDFVDVDDLLERLAFNGGGEGKRDRFPRLMDSPDPI